MLLAGFAVAGLGVAVIWWALFRDKARERRRCPRCWHDLAHTPGLTCGECGFTAAGERALFATRRRWGVAGVALVAILGFTFWTRMTVTQVGWESLLPNSALVGLAPVLEPPNSFEEGWRELTRRVIHGHLSAEQHVALASRLVAMRDGDTVRAEAAEMLQDLLRRTPRELEWPQEPSAQEARDLALREADFQQALDEVLEEWPLSMRAELPSRGVAGEPMPIAVSGHLWGQRAEWRARVRTANAVAGAGTNGSAADLTPPQSDWLAWSSAAELRYRYTPPAFLLAGALPHGPVRVDVVLQVETRRWNWRTSQWGEWTEADDVVVQDTVNAQGAVELVGIDDDAVRDAVRAAFDNPAVSWDSDERPIGVRYNGAELAGAKHDGLLLGVTLEVCENGEPRRRSRFWWQAGSGGGGGGNDSRGGRRRATQVGWAIEWEDIPALLRLRNDATGWTIRLRGDRATALRALADHREPIDDEGPADTRPDETSAGADGDGADARASSTRPLTYWDGTMEFPMTVERQGRPAPPRVWRVEPWRAPTLVP